MVLVKNVMIMVWFIYLFLTTVLKLAHPYRGCSYTGIEVAQTSAAYFSACAGLAVKHHHYPYSCKQMSHFSWERAFCPRILQMYTPILP